MISQLRRQKIVSDVNQFHYVSVDTLAAQFSVSVETIRRDLTWLERMGRLVRVHGGARTLQREDVGELFKKRRNEHTEAKQIIAAKALEMIEPDMTIGLDASSSDWYLARILPDIPLTVVTNSLEVLSTLDDRPTIRVICTGGDYCRRHADFIGDLTQQTLRRQQIDISFVSCFGVNLVTGLWENSEINAQTKRTMIKVSHKTVLLADSSKYGRRSPWNMADWNQVKYVINDGLLSKKALTHFANLGVNVL